jgi:3-deoxy-7-phosphoheptulonate synthase
MMMIIMSTEASEVQIDEVLAKIDTLGFTPHTSRGAERTVIGVVGNNPINARDTFMVMDGVDRIVPISRPYKLASREFIPENSTFPLDGVQMGGDGVVLIAGPCAVEDRNLLLECALACQEAGAHALRGGAFKPRTSPYAFQGLGEKALEMLAEVREITGMPVVTEAMSPEQVPLIAKYADVIQIGARNMQNYSLLNAAGESQTPVLLKRGMSATIEELLMAAEYILSHGNARSSSANAASAPTRPPPATPPISTLFRCSNPSPIYPSCWIPATARASGSTSPQWRVPVWPPVPMD